MTATRRACAALAVGLWMLIGAGRVGAQEGRTLLEDDFDRPDALAAWTAIDGAVVGNGPASRVALERGAVVLTATAKTERFTALTRTVAVGEARWVRVAYRVRATHLDPGPARFENANLFIRFDAGPVLTQGPLTGTRDWFRTARCFPVPPGAREVTVGLFLSMPGALAFDDVRLSVERDFVELRDAPFVYRVRPEDPRGIPDEAKAFNQESLRHVCAFLSVEPPSKIVFWKYPTLATKAVFTGRAGNAHFDGRDIHSIWATDRHEIVHLLAKAWGDPPALLAEGLAVHLSGGWQGRPVREAARARSQADPSARVSVMLSSRAFRSLRDDSTYPIAGAWVGWLLEVHGRETLRALYGALDNDEPETVNVKRLEETTGTRWSEMEEAFTRWVRAKPVD